MRYGVLYESVDSKEFSWGEDGMFKPFINDIIPEPRVGTFR